MSANLLKMGHPDFKMLLPLLLSLTALQLPEDPGPHAVGWRDLLLQDQRFGQGLVDVRVYYPASSSGPNAAADPSGGPFPLVAFQHGWLGTADGYDLICTQLASWGFFVSSTNTESGLFPDTREFAEDTRAALWWLEDESFRPGSWMEGMCDPNALWSALGHSMGGGTLSQLIAVEPRVLNVIGLQAVNLPAGAGNFQTYGGSAWWVAGSVDNLVPPGEVRDWFDRASVASRRDAYWELIGGGHSGCTDSPPGGEPLSAAEQQRITRRLATCILLAEVKGEENLLSFVLGAGAFGEPLETESLCAEPPLWVIEGGASVMTGIAGRSANRAGLAWSLDLGQFQTPYGALGFRPSSAVVAFAGSAGADGLAEQVIAPHPSWSGRTVGFAGIAAGAGRPPRFSRTGLVQYP